MATEVILPRVDMDMTEGKIAHWYVKDGEAVRKGQVLFEIETDKATMEVDSPTDGVMHGIHAEIGVTMPVGQVIGWILAPGEAPPVSSGTSAAVEVEPEAAAAVTSLSAAETPAAAASSVSATTSDATLLRATPLARSLAREHGLDLAQVVGSGPDGRILGRDLLAALSTGPSTPPSRHQMHLQWARRGSGTPLLLIHGFGADQGSWRPLVQQLPEGLPVIAVDLPNHGKSAARPVETLQELARLVLDRLDHEGIVACHVLGHSLGGGVALALAQAAPERVCSLTLLAPAGLGPEINGSFIDGLVEAADEAALKAAMTALFHNPSGLTGSFVATAFQQLQAPERRAALAEMARQLMPQGRQSQSLREVFGGLQMPVQVIWGTSDRIIPMQHAQDVPVHVGVHLLPKVGHLPQVEAVALVAALVDHQLSGVAKPA
jgi:pimeloyl-ACP methyl ester carboxylesterase